MATGPNGPLGQRVQTRVRASRQESESATGLLLAEAVCLAKGERRRSPCAKGTGVQVQAILRQWARGVDGSLCSPC